MNSKLGRDEIGRLQDVITHSALDAFYAASRAKERSSVGHSRAAKSSFKCFACDSPTSGPQPQARQMGSSAGAGAMYTGVAAYSTPPAVAAAVDAADLTPRTNAVPNPRKSAVATKHAAGVRIHTSVERMCVERRACFFGSCFCSSLFLVDEPQARPADKCLSTRSTFAHPSRSLGRVNGTAWLSFHNACWPVAILGLDCSSRTKLEGLW